MGTNGGLGVECTKFVTLLSIKLSEKQNEKYSDTLTWIRTKLSFEILHSTLLCVRGSRRPWDSNTELDVGTDYQLQAIEAGIF